MQKSSKRILAAFVTATLAGAALHFVYRLFPNVITALFSPVNESIWEHLKLLFWPYLTAALLLTKSRKNGDRTSWLFSLLIICGLMLTAGYVYYIGMNGTSEVFGPVLYVILMAIGFALPSLLSPMRGRNFIALIVAILGVMVVLFTFLPPDNAIFIDRTSEKKDAEETALTAIW